MTKKPPTLYLPPGLATEEKYVAVMLDYKVNIKGIRITILQWFQPGLTATSSASSDHHALTVDNALARLTAAYIPPSPIPGPPHEYVTLLYRQPTHFSLPDCLRNSALSSDGRHGFNLGQFVEVAGLGNPVAANWFKMQDPSSAATTSSRDDEGTQTSAKSYACTATSAN